ncbi:MAG: hypothetical protein JXA97_04530 [Anaerolineales bacterium]|nr:hypothetical protein [Anaerolineales bacterium]
MKTNNGWMIFTRVVIAVALLFGAGFLGYRIGLTQNIAQYVDFTELAPIADGDFVGRAVLTHGLRFPGSYGHPMAFGPGSILGVVFGILLLGLVIRLFTHALFGFRRPYFRRPMRPWMNYGWGDEMPPEMQEWHARMHGEKPASTDDASKA